MIKAHTWEITSNLNIEYNYNLFSKQILGMNQGDPVDSFYHKKQDIKNLMQVYLAGTFHILYDPTPRTGYHIVGSIKFPLC
jgi:hypothetical protein